MATKEVSKPKPPYPERNPLSQDAIDKGIKWAQCKICGAWIIIGPKAYDLLCAVCMIKEDREKPFIE